MKFAQAKAGNAQGWRKKRLGMARTPAPLRMSRRAISRSSLLALAAIALLPAGARAGDPLLSGYAGPGSGEQVVLGGTVVGGGSHGGGGGGGTNGGGGGASGATSSGAATRQAQAAQATQSLQAPAQASTPAPTSTTHHQASAHHGESSRASSHLTPHPQRQTGAAATSQPSDAPTSSSNQAAAASGAPTVVAYPTARVGEVSGLPVSAGGLLLLVLGIAAAVLAGLGLRRMVSGLDDPASGPQVSAS
jgi:hypothetical protein